MRNINLTTKDQTMGYPLREGLSTNGDNPINMVTGPKLNTFYTDSEQRVGVFTHNENSSFAEVATGVQNNFENANQVDGAGLMLKVSVPILGGGSNQYLLATKRKGCTATSENSLVTDPTAKFQLDTTLGGPTHRIEQRLVFKDAVKGAAKGKVSYLCGGVSGSQSEFSSKLISLIDNSTMEAHVCSHSANGDGWQMNYLTSIANVSLTPTEFEELNKACLDNGIFSIVNLESAVKSACQTFDKKDDYKTGLLGVPVTFNDISIAAFAQTPGSSFNAINR